MNNLKWIRIFLCVLPLFVSIYATVTYNETNVHVFPDNLRDLEQIMFDSLEATKNVFVQKDLSNGLEVTALITALQPIAVLVFVLRALMADESDWKETFSKIIAREMTLDNQSIIQSIERTFQSLLDNNTDMTTRKTAASVIHTNIDKMLNSFAHKESIFRKYPLLGAPPITALALFIILFDPIAKILIPLEATHPELSCKMSKILLDHRPRAVNARLEELSLFATTESERTLPLSIAMSMPYNQYGYNKTITGTMDCEKVGDKTKIKDNVELLKDNFGVDLYLGGSSCIKDYALFVRHRVEQMFPVELVDGLCENPPQRTGFGWLTIKLRDLQASRTWDGRKCDIFNSCDPYVKLFIGNKLVLETLHRRNYCCYDVGETVTSKKITKITLIKIEVWDADYGEDELVLRTEGNVDSFLRDGHRRNLLQNYINTVSFWKDEYE